jgi:hypothetical protein
MQTRPLPEKAGPRHIESMEQRLYTLDELLGFAVPEKHIQQVADLERATESSFASLAVSTPVTNDAISPTQVPWRRKLRATVR